MMPGPLRQIADGMERLVKLDQVWPAFDLLAIAQRVDIAGATDGVDGAQLAGAGLGGCMMILVRNDSLAGLLSRLRKHFYRPRKLPATAYVCTPVAGAGLLGA